MSSKKVPVRIGLTKKTADQSDISDLMSASTMEALEEFVEEALSDEDLHELPELEDEIERDADPDYVPEAGPSEKGKRLVNKPFVLPKRSLKLTEESTPVSVNTKGRSNAPIWKYFIVSDKPLAGGLIEKGAACIVEVGGIACMKRIRQYGSSTTGLNQHLERIHPKEFAAYKTGQANLQAERLSTKRTLVEHFKDLEA